MTPASNPPNNLANWCVSFNKPILSSLDPVVLQAPLDGAIVAVGMAVRLAAGVFDLNGLRSVDFYEGSQRLGSDSAAPYQMLWRPGRGIYRVRAVAVYSSRSVASPEATVTSNERPVVSLTVPRPNMVLPIFRATTLQANAYDAEGGTTRVDFGSAAPDNIGKALAQARVTAAYSRECGLRRKAGLPGSMPRLSMNTGLSAFPL